jgi:hypothetical protein
MHNHMYLWCIHTVQYMVPIFAPQETNGDPSRGPEPEIRCVTGE